MGSIAKHLRSYTVSLCENWMGTPEFDEGGETENETNKHFT